MKFLLAGRYSDSKLRKNMNGVQYIKIDTKKATIIIITLTYCNFGQIKVFFNSSMVIKVIYQIKIIVC